jgi:hypothetical protein
MPPVVVVEEPTDVFGTCNNISNLFEITDVLQNEVDCVQHMAARKYVGILQ